VCNAVPEKHTARARISDELVRICKAIAERSSFIHDSELEMHAALEQAPPPMTIRECREIEEHAAGRSDFLRAALAAHAVRIGIPQQMSVEAFVAIVLKLRQAILTDAADVHAEEDRQELVKRAAALTSSLEVSVSHLGVFRQGIPESRIDLFWSMFRHFARWANFDVADDDRSLRRRERELLLALAPEMADVAGEAMSRVAPWSRTPELPATKAADKLRREIVAAFEPLIAKQIVERFLQPGGIAALRGNPLHMAENWMMFTSSRFYDLENRARLCEIAQSKSRVVADNFYVFLSELTKAWEAEMFEPSRGDLTPILQDVDLIHPAWVAATFVAPQERLINSMKELLGRVQKHMPSGVVLKLPEWASEAKSDDSSTNPSSPDPAP
jgi:hypothetical protein